MASISTPSVGLVDRPGTFSIAADGRAQFAVRFVSAGGHYIPSVIGDTTDGSVRLGAVDGQTTIECTPASSEPLPFIYQVIFEVPFVLAAEPIRWISPISCPKWIAPPRVGPDRTTVAMVVTDVATSDSMTASFLLEPKAIGDDVLSPVDPTIISNPPN
ncbi:MAG: hypothetical protein AAGE94_25230 [Acidobacteriota bacterium]